MTIQPSPVSRPTPGQAWVLAARPKTLPAAMAPVLVGTGAALGAHHFAIGPALAALLGALLLQIGANLANDVFDFFKGADTHERLGPTRVTQAGLLTPRQVLIGMSLVFAAAVADGVYLLSVGGWPIAVLGIAAILSALAYTGGPFPLGYNGLGDIFVFLFFRFMCGLWNVLCTGRACRCTSLVGRRSSRISRREYLGRQQPEGPGDRCSGRQEDSRRAIGPHRDVGAVWPVTCPLVSRSLSHLAHAARVGMDTAFLGFAAAGLARLEACREPEWQGPESRSWRDRTIRIDLRSVVFHRACTRAVTDLV